MDLYQIHRSMLAPWGVAWDGTGTVVRAATAQAAADYYAHGLGLDPARVRAELWSPHALSSVVITATRDGRGPATSAHLRSHTAHVDRVLVGYFADYAAAMACCTALCGHKPAG